MMKMFHQFQLCPASQAQESFLLPLSIVLEAHKRINRPVNKSSLRMYKTKEGVNCVVCNPVGLTFGNAASPLMAARMYSLPLSRLREHGFRTVLQVDDGRLLSRHGPTHTYTQLLIVIAYHWYLRLRIHLRDDKSPDLWPRSEGEFSGSYFDLSTMCPFPLPANKQRHWQELWDLSMKFKKNEAVTLREYTRVVSQQMSATHHSWPVQFMLPHLRQHAAQQQSLLLRKQSLKTIWDQPISRPSKATLVAHEALLKPCRVGDHFRQTGEPLLTVTADTSATGM
ncbi:MAG: hypothetical protein COB29_15500 [Sulfitobacter sp.]|nr:MAG: hypothetical protein COB29_15500 [Sulfitobacter sp.]